MFYDVHTHRDAFLEEESPIRNIIAGVHCVAEAEETEGLVGFLSVGFHPMMLDVFSEEEWQKMLHSATHKKVLAIGECGLDVRAQTPNAIQRRIFERQIKLATELQKPLIIHCVRAFTECVHMLRGVQVPIVFHGFNNSWAKAQLLIEQGFYLSFGHSLLHNHRLKTVLSQVPLQQIFFETDDASIPVRLVYQQAAAILGITVSDVQQQIDQNYTRVFL